MTTREREFVWMGTGRAPAHLFRVRGDRLDAVALCGAYQHRDDQRQAHRDRCRACRNARRDLKERQP